MWWKKFEGRRWHEDRICNFDVINCSAVILDGYVGCTGYPDWNIGSNDAFYVGVARVEDFKLSYIIYYDTIGSSIKDIWNAVGVRYKAEQGTT